MQGRDSRAGDLSPSVRYTLFLSWFPILCGSLMEVQANEAIAQIESSNGRFETWPEFSSSSFFLFFLFFFFSFFFLGSRTARATQRDPVSKNKTNKQSLQKERKCITDIRGQSLNVNITDGW